MYSKKNFADISLEQYADIVAQTIGSTDPNELAKAAIAAGFKETQWTKALRGWNKILSDGGQKSKVWKDYIHYLSLALEKLCPDTDPLDFDDYVASTVSAYSGETLEEIASDFGYNLKQYTLEGYRWMEKLSQDKWLQTRFQLLVKKRLADKTGTSGKYEFEWYPGSMIRARKCWKCGGFKSTVSPTAYIYCDFCGTLFDYDSRKEIEDPAAIDPEEVENTLAAVTNNQLKEAFEKNDPKEYSRIMTWRTELMIEICPQSYSPRVKDRDYKNRLINDLLVPWSTVCRFDKEYMKESHRVNKKHDQTFNAIAEYMGTINSGENSESSKAISLKKKALDMTLELLTMSQEIWKIEVDLLEKNGILAKHPDGLDRETFLYVNRSTFIRPWLSLLPGDAGRSLMKAAEVDDEYIEVPRLELEDRGCLNCGKKIKAPKNAKKTMCAWCGYMLNTENRNIQCTQCGGLLAIPSGKTSQTEHNCAFCGSNWSL